MLRSIGTLLQDSGWISAICEANVASSGTVESFLPASSITRTRQAHQITVCSLHHLMKKPAYQDHCTDEPGRPPLGLEDWCVQRRRTNPHNGCRIWATHSKITYLTYVSLDRNNIADPSSSQLVATHHQTSESIAAVRGVPRWSSQWRMLVL